MLRRTAAAIICVFVLAGCSETSFLGQRYANFTAYYNTFYNARKSFDRGVRAFERTDETINQDVFLAIYPIPSRAGNRQDFEDAIKRSADVIRDHPNSKWIDDAVLLIGKSYFYQQNFVSAAQKFREAIELHTELEDEARFWLGYALTANGSLIEARDELAASLAREERSSSFEAAMNMLLGDVLVRLSEWDAAAAVIREGASSTRDRQANARARFVLGQIEEVRGNDGAAREAYALARRAQPPFELEFAAQINELRLAGRLGDLDHALSELRRMERDAKYFDRRSRVVYTRGLILQEAGDAQAAHEVFSDLLYDSDYDVAPVRGRIHYAVASLYRDADEDFVLAAAHFDTASSAIQTPFGTGNLGRADPLTELAITDSREQADMYGTYARVYHDVARMDSLLHLGSLPEEEFQDFLYDLRLRLQQEAAERERDAQRRLGNAAFTDGFLDLQDQREAAAAGPSGASGSGGFLFHRDPGSVQEGRQAFNRRWGDRPHVPGWRRRSAVDAFVAELRQSADEDGDEVVQSLLDAADPTLPVIDVSEVPRTEFAQEDMMRRRALARYELGNVLFISINDPDSAAAVYQLVIDEDAELPVAGRAFYALAELERSRGRTADANNLYRIVLDRYPGSEFEARVREQLGMEVEEATDEVALARARFDELMEAWANGDHRTAFTELIRLSLEMDHEELSPAAFMAATRVGVDWLRRDGLELTHPLPVEIDEQRIVEAGLLYEADHDTDFDMPKEEADSLTAHAGVGVGFLEAHPDQVADDAKEGLADELPGEAVDRRDEIATDAEAVAMVDSLEIRPRVLDHAEPGVSVTIELLLRRLVDVYDSSPLASQARSMLSEIEDRKAPPAGELLTSADSTSIDPSAASDSPGTTGPDAQPDSAQIHMAPQDADSDPAELDTTAAYAEDVAPQTGNEAPEMMQAEASAHVDVFSLQGDQGLFLAAGGFTLLVAGNLDPEEAETQATSMREAGFRASVFADDQDPNTFGVYVGQFQVEELAEVALESNRDFFPEGTMVVAVPVESDSL